MRVDSLDRIASSRTAAPRISSIVECCLIVSDRLNGINRMNGLLPDASRFSGANCGVPIFGFANSENPCRPVRQFVTEVTKRTGWRDYAGRMPTLRSEFHRPNLRSRESCKSGKSCLIVFDRINRINRINGMDVPPPDACRLSRGNFFVPVFGPASPVNPVNPV